MSICFRPNAKIWVWFDGDEQIEFEKRPRFLARIFTAEESELWFDKIRELSSNDAAKVSDYADHLMTHLVEWQNFSDLPISATAIMKTLEGSHIGHLIHNLPKMVNIQRDDLKKSDWQSPSHRAASAGVVETSATTNPPNANPS